MQQSCLTLRSLDVPKLSYVIRLATQRKINFSPEIEMLFLYTDDQQRDCKWLIVNDLQCIYCSLFKYNKL
jgi:hypothetical protein